MSKKTPVDEELARLMQGGTVDQLQARLDAGLDPNTLIDTHALGEVSLLTAAAKEMRHCMVRILLAKGADPNGKPGRVAPLHVAKSWEDLLMLLDARASLKLKNQHGKMAEHLHPAASYEAKMLKFARQRPLGLRAMHADKAFMLFTLARSERVVNRDGLAGLRSEVQGLDPVWDKAQALAWLDKHWALLDHVQHPEKQETDGKHLWHIWTHREGDRLLAAAACLVVTTAESPKDLLAAFRASSS
mgnify:CR=1 FL=1